MIADKHEISTKEVVGLQEAPTSLQPMTSLEENQAHARMTNTDSQVALSQFPSAKELIDQLRIGIDEGLRRTENKFAQEERTIKSEHDPHLARDERLLKAEGKDLETSTRAVEKQSEKVIHSLTTTDLKQIGTLEHAMQTDDFSQIGKLFSSYKNNPAGMDALLNGDGGALGLDMDLHGLGQEYYYSSAYHYTKDGKLSSIDVGFGDNGKANGEGSWFHQFSS